MSAKVKRTTRLTPTQRSLINMAVHSKWWFSLFSVKPSPKRGSADLTTLYLTVSKNIALRWGLLVKTPQQKPCNTV